MAGRSTLSALPPSTVRLIGSTQVITSVFSVIKELLENSFDAGSTNIDIKLDNFGLDKIEVRDNGSGIKPEDVEFVGQQHYTSKISSHSDLESLSTYGFRGEALASLCSVSEVTMTTKTATDDVGMTYSLTNQGHISSKKPSHLGQGTTVTANHLFKNLPVRKQYHNTARKKKEELKKIEDLLMSYGVICPDVRLSLRHNKELLWQKNVLPDSKSVLLSVLGRTVLNNLEKKECHQTDPKVDIEMYIPKPGTDIQVMSRTTTDRCFLFVNGRPVDLKEIHKLLRQYYCTCHNIDGQRHPIYFMSVILPPSEIDVNVDPNKTKVMLQHLDAVKKCIETELLYVYGPLDNQPSWKYADADSKVKVGEEVIDLEAKEKVTKYLSNKLNNDDITDITDIDTAESKDISQKCNESNSVELESCGSSRHEWNKTDSLNDSALDAVVGDWEDSEEDEKLSQMDISTPKLDFKSVDQTTSSRNHDVEMLENPESNRSRNLIGDVLSSKLSTNNVEDVVDSDLLSKGNKDIRSSERPGINGPDVFDSDQSVNCTQDVIDLGVGRFDISDDVLDDSFSSTQQAKNASLERHDTMTAETTSGQTSDDPGQSGVSWSRGCGLTSASGQLVQPVTLLAPSPSHVPGKRPPSPSHNSSMLKHLAPPEKKRALGEKSLLQGQTTLYDLVENQAVRQDSAFDIFIKEKTKEVINEHPDANGEEVTAILEDTWNNMAETDKQKYRTARWNMYSKDLKEKDLSMKVKKKVDKGRSSVRDHLLSSSKKSVSRKDAKKTSDVEFCLADLKHKYTQAFRDSQSQISKAENMALIGPLKSCGAWVCCHGNKILLANPHRLAETVLYHKLLSQHKLTAQPMEKPVTLSLSNIGDESLMTTLQKLANENWTPDPYANIEDSRITSNGFSVRCRKDEDGQFHANLVGLAKDIPMFGVADLSETLDLITHTSADTLKRSRPLKVINFLKSEAVRMMRQTTQRGHDDLLELLEQLDTVLPEGCKKCLHEKPFFHEVFDLDSVHQCDDTIADSQITQG